MSLIDSLRTGNSLTDNGAVTNSTSLNAVLDLFFLCGAARTMSEQDILLIWNKAFAQDPILSMKCLFFSRDPRDGNGERRFFRTIWNSLNIQTKEQYKQYVPLWGRWDDLWYNNDTSLLSYIGEQLMDSSAENRGLLCKWFPRKGPIFIAMQKVLKMGPKALRKLIVEGSKTVEQSMSSNQWNTIEYNKVPSQAFNKYKKAFEKRDSERFNQFINEEKDFIKSGTLFPYQLYQSYKKGEREDIIDAQWNNLPNYLSNTEINTFIPVCDISGSMATGSGLPMDISISLGVYLAQKNKGIFENAFISFSEEPVVQYIKGTSACSLFKQIDRSTVGYNTNIEKVFEVILNTAIRDNIPESEMPKNILIISDMEFDEACNNPEKSIFQNIDIMYSNTKYKRPNLVFWNVNGRVGNVPVNINDKGVALISGSGPSIIKSILGSTDLSPIGVMMQVLNQYQFIL